MNTADYLKILVDEIHSTAVATLADDGCVGCGACLSVCPQQCIDISGIPAIIDQNRCLHCGRCVEACPAGAIEHRSRWR